jgi:hypothetical protein
MASSFDCQSRSPTDHSSRTLSRHAHYVKIGANAGIAAHPADAVDNRNNSRVWVLAPHDRRDELRFSVPSRREPERPARSGGRIHKIMIENGQPADARLGEIESTWGAQ